VDTKSNESRSPETGQHVVGKHQGPGLWPGLLARVGSWLLGGRVSDVWCFGVAYALLLPFFLAPLFATRLLPGLDLPFHLAAADMLAKLGRADSPYAPYYEGGLHIAPYAAHFLALAALGKVMNLLTAHKLVIVLYVAGLPLATASLLAACRRSRIPALLAFPLAYNLALHYGFVTFALSLPVLLWLLAETTRLAHAEERRAFTVRWCRTALVASLLFLCHLQNFLFGVCAAAAFALLAAAPFRRKLLALASLGPALAGLLYWQLATPPISAQAEITPSLAWRYLKIRRLEDLGRGNLLDDLGNRILLIPSHAMRAFADESNVPACKWLVLIMVAYVLIGLLAWPAPGMGGPSHESRRGRMRLAGLVGFVGALGAYLALPHHLQELQLMTFFPRFSVLVLLMFLLFVPAGLLRLRGFLALLLPVPALALGVFYGRLLFVHYRAYADEVADFVAVAEKTPPGGKTLGFVYDRRSRVMSVESALLGLPAYYPALRPAPGSMVPPAYCHLRHMPCRLKPAAESFPSPWLPDSFVAAKMLPIFDTFFIRSMPPRADPFRGYHRMVDLVARSGTWVALRRKPVPVVPDPPPPAPATSLPPPALPALPAPPAKPAAAVPQSSRPLHLVVPPVRGTFLPRRR